MQYQSGAQHPQYAQEGIYSGEYPIYEDQAQLGDAYLPHNSNASMLQQQQQNLMDTHGYPIGQEYADENIQHEQQAQYTYHDAQCPQNYLNQQNQNRNRANYNQYSMQTYGPAIDQQTAADCELTLCR